MFSAPLILFAQQPSVCCLINEYDDDDISVVITSINRGKWHWAYETPKLYKLLFYEHSVNSVYILVFYAILVISKTRHFSAS